MKLRTCLLALLCFLILTGAQAQKAVQQSQTTQNLSFGPVVQNADHNTAMTGLVAPAPAVTTATGGSTTTITTATSAVAGQTVQWGASTTTTALRGLTYVISSVSGTGPYTLTMPTMAGTPVSTDTYTVYNTAAGSATTTSITSQVSVSVGQWVQFTSFSTTSALRGTGAWVTAVSGSAGAYTLTLAPALGSAPASTDTFTLSNLIVTICKNAGTFAPAQGALSESGNGWYTLAGNATDENTLGDINVHWAVLGGTAGDSNERICAAVVSYNPLSGSNLGLTALPTAAPATAGGLITNGSGSGQIAPDGSGNVPVSMSQALPTTSTANTVGQGLWASAQHIGRMGTAQSGTSSTITLDAGASAVDGIYNSYFVKIYSGTGAGQFATITAYVGSTKVATINRPGGGTWTTAPDSTSLFWIEPQPYVTVQSNGDKTGYALSQSFPSNFGTLAIDSSGNIRLQGGEHLEIKSDVKDALADAPYGSGLDANSPYTKIATTNTQVATNGTNITGIKAQTDKLGFTGSGPYTVNSTGGGGGDPFALATSTAYSAGTFGALLKTQLDVAISTRLATSGYTAPTDPFSLPTSTAYSAGTFGALFKTQLDAAISSRLASGSYTAAPTASQIAATILSNPSNLLVTDNTGKVGANNLPTDYALRGVAPTWWVAPPTFTANDIRDAIFAYSVETGITFAQALRIIGAINGGDNDKTGHTFKALGNPGTVRVIYNTDGTRTLSP